MNTAHKRISAFAVELPYRMPGYPGADEQPTRQMLGWTYVGIPFGSSAGGADTLCKRGSSIQFDQVYFMTYPMPDGVIAQEDRQHAAYKYCGILAGPAVVSTPTGYLDHVLGRGFVWGMTSGMG